MDADSSVFAFRPQSFTTSTKTRHEVSLTWFIRLRWCAAAAQLLLVGTARWILKFDFQILPLVLLTSIVIISNVFLYLRSFSKTPVSQRYFEIAFIVDVVVLTGLLYLTGGAANPFSIFYLVHIILAAVVLGERWTWIMSALSIMFYGLLFAAHGVSHSMAEHMQGYSSHLQGMWVAFAFASILLAFFVNRILLSLKKRDEEAAALSLRAAKAEQFAALVNLAAGAAHELGTPLATIAVAAEEIRRGISSGRNSDEQCADADLISGELQRCKHILEAMGGRGSEVRGEMPSRFTLSELRNDLAQEFGALGIADKAIKTFEKNIELTLPREILTRSLVSLVRNSIDADPTRDIQVEANVMESAIEFRVSDCGSGIEPKLLSHIGEPFLTTKPPGKGMGLGVFLVKVFAERVGGALNYESEIGRGTIARLQLPIEFA